MRLQCDLSIICNKMYILFEKIQKIFFCSKTCEHSTYENQIDKIYVQEKCSKCEERKISEDTKNISENNLFYSIDQLSSSELTAQVDKLIDEIARMTQDPKQMNKAIICFDRLFEKVNDIVINDKIISFHTKDHRFGLILTKYSNISKENLQELANSEDVDLQKMAINRLRKTYSSDIDKFNTIDLKVLKVHLDPHEYEIEDEIRAKEAVNKVLADGTYHMLLYISKGIAIERKSKLIEIDDLKKGAEYIVFYQKIDRELLDILCSLFADITTKEIRDDFDEWLIRAYKYEKLQYANDVKDFIGKIKPFDSKKICALSQSAEMLSIQCELLKNSITPKDVLLLAKWISSDEESVKISLNHFLNALSSFKIDDEIMKLIDNNNEYKKIDDVWKKVQQARDEDKKDFEDDFKSSNVLSWFKDNLNVIIGKYEVE